MIDYETHESLAATGARHPEVADVVELLRSHVERMDAEPLRGKCLRALDASDPGGMTHFDGVYTLGLLFLRLARPEPPGDPIPEVPS